MGAHGERKRDEREDQGGNREGEPLVQLDLVRGAPVGVGELADARDQGAERQVLLGLFQARRALER